MLDYLYRVMQIDEAWSVREARGFTWWAYNLAQRVWAEPPIEIDGGKVVSFRIQTDVFREVTDLDAIACAVELWNRLTTLSGFIFDRAQGTVKLACSMVCEEENVQNLGSLLAAAMAIQCADAHAVAEQAAGKPGCKPGTSCHPRNGPRPTLDKLLRVREEVIAPRGIDPSPVEEEHVRSAAALLEGLLRRDRVGTVAMRIEGASLTAELPFWADIPTGKQMRAHGRIIQRMTSQLEVSAQVPHPRWGNGLFLLPRLPVDAKLEPGLELVRKLNRAAATEPLGFSQFGAWNIEPGDDGGLEFHAFVPAAIAQPHQLPWLIAQMFARNLWARDSLSEHFGIRVELAAQLPEMLPA